MSKFSEEVRNYISSQINIFIEPLVFDIVVKRPKDPVEFAIKWLKDYNLKKSIKSLESDSDSGSESEEKDEVKELEKKVVSKKIIRKNRSRFGISEEVFGEFNRRQDLKLSECSNFEENKILVRSLISSSILFQNVDRKDQEILIRAMVRKQTEQHEIIIKEGETGDILYIVESGDYDCYKKINGQNTYIKTYEYGQAFGQLALMYNSPRAASIITRKAGILLLLDRATFSQVLKIAAIRKREVITNAVEKVKIFKHITSSQKQKFLDILKEERFSEDQYIIKQGERGDKFYIVLEGTLVAQKKEEGDEMPKIVYKYEVGDYFGELALINDISRQASVKAVTFSKVAAMSRGDFKRTFGDLQQAFKENSDRYAH